MDDRRNTGFTRSDFSDYRSRISHFSCKYRDALGSIIFAGSCCCDFYAFIGNVLCDLSRFNHKYISQEKIKCDKLLAFCSYHPNSCVFCDMDFFGKESLINFSITEPMPFARLLLIRRRFTLCTHKNPSFVCRTEEGFCHDTRITYDRPCRSFISLDSFSATKASTLRCRKAESEYARCLIPRCTPKARFLW